MCLISFSWQPDSDTPLVLTANRDEFHTRPAKPAQFWEEHPNMLAGQDLEAGGTWIGVTKQGRFAALTNVRQLPPPYEGQISRGNLVKDFLTDNMSAKDYLADIHKKGRLYDGFNLIVGDRNTCHYLSNRTNTGPRTLTAGLYGLSNAQLDTPWPKAKFAKSVLKQWMQDKKGELAGLLNQRETYPKHQLPDTGIGEPWETLLSSPFIISPQYGTRASTGLILGQNETRFKEISYDAAGNVVHQVDFEF
jgi:uncharacterized protein with NRDE domain